MSTIKVDTIVASDGQYHAELSNTRQKRGFVFTLVDSSNQIQTGSFNVSSLTNETAEIEVNLTNAMSDAFFANCWWR